MTLFAPPPDPVDDPLPWVTDRLRRAGAFTTMPALNGLDPVKDRRMAPASAAALLEVLTQTVAALHDDGKSYVVVLDPKSASAGTLLEKRIVEVGSRPWSDKDMSEGQRAAVMAGLALHEVGHIRFARQYSGAVTRLFGKENVTGAISTLSNLAADMHDEAAACRVFPGLAPTVAVTLWWVGGKGLLPLRPCTIALHRSVADRVNMAIAACRYPWQVDWDSREAREWHEWWVEWGERAAQAEAPKDHALIVQEAILKVREIGAPEDETPPPTEPCDDGDPSEDEDQSQGDEPQDGPEGDSDPDEGEDEPSDGPGPQRGSDEPTEDEDEPTRGRDMSDDEPEPEYDEEDDHGDGDLEDTDDVEDDTDEWPDDDESDEDGDDEGDDESEDDEDGDEPRRQPGHEPTDQWSDRGSTAEEAAAFDANESPDPSRFDRTCVKDASKDPRTDQHLQRQAEKVTRGKREGMRRRTYYHPTSCTGHYGRTVVSIPRKGKRWVYDV